MSMPSPQGEESLNAKRIRINLLFDAVINENGSREKEIFDRCYEAVAAQALSRFLRDTTSCPPEVVEFCQTLLAPKGGTPAT